jgi:branched-subunit amino acid transport protein AzlD
MMDNLKEHRVEYFILFVAIAIFLVLTYTYRFNKSMLVALTGSASLFYIVWGVVHHWIRGKLTRSIAAEYILYAILAFMLFFTVLSF